MDVLPNSIGTDPRSHILSLSTIACSTIMEVKDLSTLQGLHQFPELRRLRTLRNPFHISISSACQKTLSFVCVPPELVNDPDNYCCRVAIRSFVDMQSIPQNSPNVTLTVIGVLGDYPSYDKIGAAVTKLAGYEDLFSCLHKTKDKWPKRSPAFVRPQVGITAEKLPRQALERKLPQPQCRTQFCTCSSSSFPPHLPAAAISRPVITHSVTAASATSNSAPARIPCPTNPAKHPSGESSGRTRFHSPERMSSLSVMSSRSSRRIAVRTPDPQISPIATIANAQTSPRSPPPPPPPSPPPPPPPPPPNSPPPPPPPLHPTPPPPAGPLAASVLSPAETPATSAAGPPKPLSPALPRSLPSRPTAPFILADIPARFHRYFRSIPPEFHSLLPVGFPYGRRATNVSLLQYMCIALLGRQRGRYNDICESVEIHVQATGLYSLTFVGTVINGFPLEQIPYVAPRNQSYKTCSYGCATDKLSNTCNTRSHHKPKRFDADRQACSHLPQCLQFCPSAEEFRRVRDFGVEGGLRICFHKYKGQATQHFRTQLRQVGQSLLDFASKDLGMTDDCITAWNRVEAGKFLDSR